MKALVSVFSSLRVRVMIGVVVPLTLALALAALVQVSRHRELMIENLEQFSISVGDGVEMALTQSMLRQDREALAQVARDLVSRGSIRRVMILDAKGIVRIASSPPDVGTKPPIAGDKSTSSVTTDASGLQVFRTITAIENRAVCQSCHGNAPLNGTLVIDLPYEGVDAHLWTDLYQNIALSVAAVILVSLTVNLLLNRIVIDKLQRFHAAVSRFSSGDFSARVKVEGQDEVAELARAVNGMAEGLGEKARLELQVTLNAHELERRSARLSALYRVALESSRSLDLEQVMRAGLESALDVMAMEAGEIRLTADSGPTLVIQSAIGSSDDFASEENGLTIGECLCGRVAARGELVTVGQMAANAQATRLTCRRLGYRALAAVPLQARGRVVGVLSLHSRATREFSPDDTTTLQALGDQLGLAIDNALLYSQMESRVAELSRQVQHLAVTEERVRLAREVHDGLAQSLSLLNLRLQTLRQRVGGGWPASAELAEMSVIVGEAYEDARQAISDLRTPIDGGIVEALTDYVQNFALKHDLQAEIALDPDARVSSCPADASPQVLRIVQEALANVRKHAHARRVTLGFERRDGHLCIRLADDGVGFDSSRAEGDGHYGLAIMRERAASFGGDVQIESAPGAGTTVAVAVPVECDE